MNIKGLSGIAIVIRMKSQNTIGKQITTLVRIRRKMLIGKSGYFLETQRNHTFSEESSLHFKIKLIKVDQNFLHDF